MASLQETPVVSPRGVYVERQRANIYTMMLVIALLAIATACACLWAEMNDYNWDVKALGAKVSPEAPLDIDQLLQQSGAEATSTAAPTADQQPEASADETLPTDETPAADGEPLPPSADDATDGTAADAAATDADAGQ